VEVMDETMLRTRETLAPLVAVYFILYHLFVTLVRLLILGCLHPVVCVIKDDHYNVSDIIKQWICCQLSNPS
jgi:hypothetical protein